ncbi:hypothetical protein SOV_12030 [Sporomusa ovata DSM 2662]|uniref:Chromosome partition protein smc n=1 Tax=Sporomusa ovata TaxID=2378 RepID=A0A0U1KXU2_9FIRM|nr:hypothetical protein [Sporomusa ovata]EQB28815.1 hypothetical protein SOV_1c05410 [Sporomusa ovata DSM 2662]CQR72240.1 hypothetical protein SpAn4DRAFT_2700 [Sporomusa ovata]
MEELLKQIIARLDRMEEGQQQTNKCFDRIESDLTDLKTTVSNIAGQQRENTEFIKALLHRTEELNAQTHSIGHGLNVLTGKAATKEDVAELNAKFEVLNSRLFQQEAAIHQLKAVK